MKKVKSVYKEYPVDGVIDSPNLLSKEIKSIEYHEPRGEGDQHYCDVNYVGGKTLRIFRPDSIVFEEDDSKYTDMQYIERDKN
jgi:hypothetical protein